MPETVMTPAEVRRAIKQVQLDQDDVAYLSRATRLPIHAQRAHAVLVAPTIMAFFHPCGHTSWVDYSGVGPGRLGPAACSMFVKRWSWRQGGVTAPCHQCVPKKQRTGARKGTPKVRSGPNWKVVAP